MKSTKLQFENSNGQSLIGKLDLPDTATAIAYAVFAHCFTCTKNIKAAVNISKSLTASGIAVLRFDFTGLGESEGDFAQTNFSSNIDDLIAAAQYLDKNFQAPQLLVGHSLGGTAALQAAQHIPSVVAVTTIASPSSPKHLAKLLVNTSEEIAAQGEACVTIGPQTFKITRQLIDNLEQTKMERTIKQLNRALLILHSPADTVVSIDNAGAIFQQARHPKSFVSLDDADHLLADTNHSQYAGKLIAAWSLKYINPGQTPAGEAYSAEHYNTVTVDIGRDKYLSNISTRQHLAVADEPATLGGKDLGPSPYEYLLAALGSCTAITLRMYADRKSWPLDAVTVKLVHRKEHGSDCTDCERKTRHIDRITRSIKLAGPLDDDHKSRLLEIANKCPVHQTLHANVQIDTLLSD